MLRASYRRAAYGSTGRAAAVAGGEDGALDGTRRASTGPALLIAVTIVIGALVAPAGALTPLARTDVAAFTSRAEAWTDARDAHRDLAHEQALALAEAARNAEAEQAAAAQAAAAEAVEAAARATTTTAAPTTTTAPPTTTTTAAPTTTAPTPVASAAGEPTPSQWAALRGCEASGNYGAVSANGRYRGAYQFSQATWDWIAGMTTPALVGADPAAAGPADQDAMAVALWHRRGWSSWPHCGALAAAS